MYGSLRLSVGKHLVKPSNLVSIQNASTCWLVPHASELDDISRHAILSNTTILSPLPTIAQLLYFCARSKLCCTTLALQFSGQAIYCTVIHKPTMASSYWESTQRKFWTFTKQQLAFERKKIEESERNLVNLYPLPDRRYLSIYFGNRTSLTSCEIPS